MTYSWYIVQTHSGKEKRVSSSIREEAARSKLSDDIDEILIPTENMVELKRGKKVNTEKKFFPGYIIVKMKMTDHTWQLIKNIKSVTGFLGGKGRPQPISESEVNRIYKQMEEGVIKAKSKIAYEVGESVRVNDGPFESFVGVVEEVDEDKAVLKISVSIFGRSTPVKLEFEQVEKV